MRQIVFAAIAAVVGMLAAAPANATLLSPNSGIVSSSDVALPTGSTLDATTGPQTLSINTTSGLLDVTATASVYTDKSTGTLDFVYTISNNSDSKDIVGQVTVGNFANAASAPTNGTLLTGQIDVGSDSSSSGQAPASVSWSANAQTVVWYYNTDVSSGNSSQTLVIKTNATEYTNGSLSVQDSGTIQFQGFQPGPEPSTMALAALGTLGFVGYGIRRRKVRTA